MPSPPQPTIHLPYKVRFQWPLLCAMAFLAFLAIVLIVTAEQGPPYTVRSLSTMDPHTAHSVLWGLAVLGLGLSALPAAAAVVTHWRPRAIVVSPDAITAPQSPLGGPDITIPFAAMTAVEIRRLSVFDALTIQHVGGRLHIFSYSLPKASSLDTLRDLISERIDAIRAEPQPPLG